MSLFPINYCSTNRKILQNKAFFVEKIFLSSVGFFVCFWIISIPAKAEVKGAKTDGLGTIVNGTLNGSCDKGRCLITGGSDAGENRFHKFSTFDTRGQITGVKFETKGKQNIVVAVTSKKGSYINKPIEFSSPSNLFWLSPGGINLNSGGGFFNIPKINITTANSLKFKSDIFKVDDNNHHSLKNIQGNPLPGSSGFSNSGVISVGSSNPKITLNGISLNIDKSLFVDSLKGEVEIINSKLSSNSDTGKGGSLTFTGDKVTIKENSRIVAQGSNGGGTIQIGGSWQNKDKDVRQANNVSIKSNTVIDTSSTKYGNGGTIVVWSDVNKLNGWTNVEGSLISLGGKQGGNGGNIETSGSNLNIDYANVDISSIEGKNGLWLLDPFTYEINLDNRNAIQNALIRGSNITIQTTDARNNQTSQEIPGQSSNLGNINVNVNLDYSGGNGELILDASNNIKIEEGKTITTGRGGLTLDAENGIIGSGNIALSNGATLKLIQAEDSEFSGKISGYDNIIKSGIGELKFSGVHTYNGKTKVEEGVLTFGINSGVNSASDLEINNGATLKAQNSLTFRSIEGLGSYLIDGNLVNLKINTPTEINKDFSGVIKSTFSTSKVIKEGPGTQILSGINTYLGETKVKSGILTINGSVVGSVNCIGGQSNSCTTNITENENLNEAIAVADNKNLTNDFIVNDKNLNSIFIPSENKFELGLDLTNSFKFLDRDSSEPRRPIAGELGKTPFGEPRRPIAGEPGEVPFGEPRRPIAGEPGEAPFGEPRRPIAGEPQRKGSIKSNQLAKENKSIPNQTRSNSNLSKGINTREIIVSRMIKNDNLATTRISRFFDISEISDKVTPTPEQLQAILNKARLRYGKKLRSGFKNQNSLLRENNQFLIASNTNDLPLNILRSTFIPEFNPENYNPAVLHIQFTLAKNKTTSLNKDAFIDLTLIPANGEVAGRRVEISTNDLSKLLRQFYKQLSRQESLNVDDPTSPSRRLHSLLIDEITPLLEKNQVSTLLIAADRGLQALPFAALHDGEQYFGERFAFALTPSLALTDTTLSETKNPKLLAFGASKFEQLASLPLVPQELKQIGQANQKDLFLNKDFTPKTLFSNAGQSQYDRLHIATHAEFLPGGPKKSQIYSGTRPISMMELSKLRSARQGRPLDLVVLSACRTAIGDPDSELGFSGLALQAGARSAIGTLWYVDDVVTSAYFIQLYRFLERDIPKAEALQLTRQAFIRNLLKVDEDKIIGVYGEPLLTGLNMTQQRIVKNGISNPFFWAGIELMGSAW